MKVTRTNEKEAKGQAGLQSQSRQKSNKSYRTEKINCNSDTEE